MSGFKTVFRTVKWCFNNDKDSEKYRYYHNNLEIERLTYATRKNYIAVKYIDGTWDDLSINTSIQVDRR